MTRGAPKTRKAGAGTNGARSLTLQEAIEHTLNDAVSDLASRQDSDGHIVYELEADTTIPSEYILLNHFLGEPEPELEAELADYIRRQQSDRHGGWPLFYDGAFDISATVKAYYALKLTGDDPDDEHMVRARHAILEYGGAEKANVFTRYMLALFGQVPWRAVPAMPVELMLMPRWFPVNIWKMSYWSRTVIAPLLILAAKKPLAVNPRGVHVPELFVTPPDRIRQWQTNPTGSAWGEFFLQLDKILYPFDKHVLARLPTRKRAIQRALEFITPRLNGEDGLGAIYPAMANTVMAFRVLGYPKDHPDLVIAHQSVRKLITRGKDGRYVQPCLSPVWDTALAAHAFAEAGMDHESAPLARSCEWLSEKQILDVKGDWAIKAPDLEPGGWAFQYANDYYPDVDDTAVVGMILDRTDSKRYAHAISRAATWIKGMQSTNGGWGAFDIDNDSEFLNSIPFADHGALLDPPTVDVTARCVGFLAQIGHDRSEPAVARALEFLKREQEEDGSWFGRWGTNYIYGTWSVLSALNAVGEDMSAPYVRRAVEWLLSRQREDGGWGEDGATYWQEHRTEAKESTPSQTAWALLALMAAGEVDNPAVERGVNYLLSHPREGSKWEEPWFTAVGFPRVFYLRYHGYSAYFPVWALARYRNLKQSNTRRPAWGM